MPLQSVAMILKAFMLSHKKINIDTDTYVERQLKYSLDSPSAECKRATNQASLGVKLPKKLNSLQTLPCYMAMIKKAIYIKQWPLQQKCNN